MKKNRLSLVIVLCCLMLWFAPAYATAEEENYYLNDNLEKQTYSPNNYTACGNYGCDDFIFFDTDKIDGVTVYLIIGPVDSGHPEGSLAVKWVFNPLKCKWVLQFVFYSHCKNKFPFISKNEPPRRYLRQIKCTRSFPKNPYDWQPFKYRLFKPRYPQYPPC